MALNVCVAGSKAGRENFCKGIGKKGSAEDFTFYTTSYQGKLIHLFEPSAYPEKVDALLDPLSLSDFVVFVVDELNAEFGEQVLLLDLAGMNGVFATDLDVSQYVKGTVLEKWPVVSAEEAKRLVIGEWKPPERQGEPIVFIDHAFDVKGVGSVLLGVVRYGKIAVHDKMVCNPQGGELEIRSIQKNDVDEKEGFSTDRVGLAIKGLTSKDVKRGTVLAAKPLKVVKELPANISYSKFAAKDSKLLHAFHCLQSSPCKLEDGKLLFEKPLALVAGEPVILCDLNKKMRAVGKVSF